MEADYCVEKVSVAEYNSCFHLVMKGIFVRALLLLIKLLKENPKLYFPQNLRCIYLLISDRMCCSDDNCYDSTVLSPIADRFSFVFRVRKK